MGLEARWLGTPQGRGRVLLRLAIPAVVRHQQIGAGSFSNTVDLFDGSGEHEHSPVAPTVQSLGVMAAQSCPPAGRDIAVTMVDCSNQRGIGGRVMDDFPGGPASVC